MKFKVRRTSESVKELREDSFESLEQLRDWALGLDYEIIIDFTLMTIEVYDDYRE